MAPGWPGDFYIFLHRHSIQQNANHLRGSNLDVSRVESGRLKPDVQRLPLTALKVQKEACRSALSKRKFRQALELARGAEALAHVHKQPNGKKALQLKAS